ncbi:hypothetical protein ACFQ9X_12635 [Catenulispora yoronensis]
MKQRAARRARARTLPAIAIVIALVGACGESGSVTQNPTTGTTSGAPASREAIVAYGYAPDPHGTAVYQPDVVLVGGGPQIVRSVSDDGLTWTIDGHAPNADKLAVGSVMFATSRAVGRVLSLRRQGSDLVLLLAPVNFTDVVKDAHITVDQALDVSGMTVQEIPGQRDQLSDQGPATGGATPTSGAPATTTTDAAAVTGPDGAADNTTGITPNTAPGTAVPADFHPAVPAAFHPAPDATITLPAVQLIAAPPGSGTLPPPKPNGGAKIPITVGAWTATVSADATSLGMQLDHKSDSGLKATVTMKFPVDNLHIGSDTTVVGGKATATGFTITGIKGMEVSLSGGAGNGSADNSKVKFEVPIEMHFPIPPGPATAGLPVDISLKWSFLIETALTGKNSTVFATGKYTLDGPLGITAHGGVQVPKLTVQQSLLDSISGIAIGPSGIVGATKIKVRVGFGTPAASAAPTSPSPPPRASPRARPSARHWSAATAPPWT